MKIFLAGGTGFIGRRLAERLLAEGHQLSLLTRTNRAPVPAEGPVRFVAGDGVVPGPWQEAVRGAGAVINMAGATIFNRWTERTKRIIRESRIRTTANIVAALETDPAPGRVLLNSSAVGYYGFHGDEELDESAGPGDDFLAGLCRDWENAAGRAAAAGVRTVLVRTGIVLGEKGGALGTMTPLFRAGLGGRLGSGRQWFSWIHREDLISALIFALGRNDVSGPVNMCAPNPVRNRDLARALGEALRRPAFVPAPGFAVRIAFGEFADFILKGQRVVPRILLDRGFGFVHPDLPAALAAIFPPELKRGRVVR
jgi:uncharacterized protein (TIGR01777 family)